MATKKQTKEEQLTAEQLLEARVDAMMDAKKAAVSAEPAVEPTEAVGAPSLSGKQKVTVAQPAAEVEVAPKPVAVPEPTVQVASEPKTESTEDITVGPANLDTPQSDAAIADIVAQEADEVLAAEDAGVASARLAAETTTEEPKKHGHPVFWFMVTLVAILAVIAAVMVTHPSLAP